MDEGHTQSSLTDAFAQFLRERYSEEINKLPGTHKFSVDVDYNHLLASAGGSDDKDDELTEQIIRNINSKPSVMEAFNAAIFLVLCVKYPDYAEMYRDKFRIRLFNPPNIITPRELNVEHINKLTGIRGLVTRTSQVFPMPISAVYECKFGHVIPVETHNSTIRAPTKCSDPTCKERDLELNESASIFVDAQRIRVQEQPEDLPSGQMPALFEMVLKYDLIDENRAGNRVIVIGYPRVKENARSKDPLTRFVFDVEVNNIKQIKETNGKFKLTDKNRDMLNKLLKQNKLYETLVNSIAPNIVGHETIKESILLLLASVGDEGLQRRNNSHILLVGDPGMAKSELLAFATKVAPRGLYASGKSSSAAGLTASAVKGENGVMYLEAGAVVLADRGIVCIDEFDKMSQDDRSALHEAMEQQRFSYNKGGLSATLNARVSVLAAANPIMGSYDPYKTIAENIALPASLLSRFDLVFILRDIPNEKQDAIIADHILNNRKSSSLRIEPKVITQYLEYIKNITPKLSSSTIKILDDFYKNMRKSAQDGFPITPRQLEGLMRLASARAKLLQKSIVEEEDANAVIDIFKSMLADSGTDPETGKIDMGVYQGKPKSGVAKHQLFMDVFKQLVQSYGGIVPEHDLIQELGSTNKFENPKEFIRKMVLNGVIVEPKVGEYKLF